MHVGTAERKKNDVCQAHRAREEDGTKSSTGPVNFGVAFKDMPAAILTLLRNPVFMCLCLCSASEGILQNALITFLPKLIANQFHLTAKWSAIATGMT